MIEHRCKRCGGELARESEVNWRCPYCGSHYEDEAVVKNTLTMKALFDEQKLEIINNLRRNLYDATKAAYISSVEITTICGELKKYIPDDFAANFYIIAAGSNEKSIVSLLRGVNVEEHEEYLEDIITFMIRNVQSEYLLDLNNLIEKAFKLKNLALYEKYSTELSVEAEKVQSGIYETKLPREVFLAYSSKFPVNLPRGAKSAAAPPGAPNFAPLMTIISARV